MVAVCFSPFGLPSISVPCAQCQSRQPSSGTTNRFHICQSIYKSAQMALCPLLELVRKLDCGVSKVSQVEVEGESSTSSNQKKTVFTKRKKKLGEQNRSLGSNTYTVKLESNHLQQCHSHRLSRRVKFKCYPINISPIMVALSGL